MRHIAVIGAGPAGLGAAQVLAQNGCHVTLLNDALRPGGLAEYGFYPTKTTDISKHRNQAHETLAHPNVRYRGGVRFGHHADISKDDLNALGFDAVLVAIGAPAPRPSPVADTDGLSNVYDARTLYLGYSGRPEWNVSNVELGSRLAIVGTGNVAINIARWAVEQGVGDILILARRGPLQRRYSEREIHCIGGHVGRNALQHEMERIGAELSATGTSAEAAYHELTSGLGNTRVAHSASVIRFRFAT